MRFPLHSAHSHVRGWLLGSTMLAGLAMLPHVAFADGGAGGEINGNPGSAGGIDSTTAAGGAGGNGIANGDQGGGGGGAGTTGGAGGTGDNNAAGGAGGLNSNGADGLAPGSGGGGGAHGGSGASLLSGVSFTGGNGGVGGQGGFESGGGGGAGGYGFVVTGSGNVGSTGSAAVIAGGGGGSGGLGVNSNSGGLYGTSGHGLVISSNAGVTLTVDGTVRGGPNVFGQAGYGLVGSNINLTIAGGTVAGGARGNNGPAEAIVFTGGVNALTLNNATINGAIAVTGSLAITPTGTTTLSNVIEGSGSVSKSGADKLILGGASLYTGTTTVNAGTLAVNGSIEQSSGVAVNSGGTLGGTGAVSSVTINNGGTLAPGNSIGTINVTGDVTFNAGSTYAVEVSPTSADKTVATGTANLTGGTVKATYQAGTYFSNTHTIFIANDPAGRNGTQFAGLTNVSLPAGFTAALAYPNANNVQLVVTMSGGGGGSTFNMPPNQQRAGNAVANHFNNGGALPPGFVTLAGLTGTQQLNGYAQVSGESGAAGPVNTSFSATNSFVSTILDPSIDGRGGDIGGALPLGYAPERSLSPEASEAYAAVTPRDRRSDPFAARWSVWASGYGGSSSVNGASSVGSSDTTSRIYGTVVGADYRLSRDTLFGFALGGAGASFGTTGLGSGRADLFQAGIYGRHNIGAWYLAGALAFGWQDVTTTRTVTVAGVDTLEGRFDTNTFSARGELGHRYATPFAGFTPYAALQVTSVHAPAYAETARAGSNQFALAFTSQTTDNLRSELGLRTDKSFPTPDGLFTLRGRAAWAHDSDTNRNITPTFQALPGSQSFSVNGARPAADGLLLTGGAEMNWHDGWAVAASYEGEFSRTTTSNAGKGVLRRAF